MENKDMPFIVSIERFKPHALKLEHGEGYFMSHSHAYDELTLILEGEGYYSSPEQNIKVSAGDLVLIPPELHHGYVCTESWQGISVHFYHDQLPVHCRYLFHGPGRGLDRIYSTHLSDDQLAWANISLSQLEKEWGSAGHDSVSHQLMCLAMETTLLLFQRSHALESPYPANATGQVIIQEVLKDIHSSYHTPITVSELASRHFLSESNLRKKFTEAVGVSPKQYIINLRLMEAKRLLQQTNKAIEIISSQVGFTSSSRFYDYFVKFTGVTPLEWRMHNTN